MILPPGHFELLQTKFERAKNAFNIASNPTKLQRNAYKKAKKKYEAARVVLNAKPSISRRSIVKRGLTSVVEDQHPSTSSSSPPPIDIPIMGTPGFGENETQGNNDALSEIALLKEQLFEKDKKSKNWKNMFI